MHRHGWRNYIKAWDRQITSFGRTRRQPIKMARNLATLLLVIFALNLHAQDLTASKSESTGVVYRCSLKNGSLKYTTKPAPGCPPLSIPQRPRHAVCASARGEARSHSSAFPSHSPSATPRSTVLTCSTHQQEGSAPFGGSWKRKAIRRAALPPRAPWSIRQRCLATAGGAFLHRSAPTR